jgi:hypothetical protein
MGGVERWASSTWLNAAIAWEVVRRTDADVDLRCIPERRTGREHAATTEAGIVECVAERFEVDVVDREPHGAASEQYRCEFGEESDNDGRRVVVVGSNGQPVRGRAARVSRATRIAAS